MPIKRIPGTRPLHEAIVYAVPLSTLTLHIILRQSCSLAAADINTCLNEALLETRKQTQTAPVDGLYRCKLPTPSKLGFTIISKASLGNLKWADVTTVLHGLQGFFQERPEYVELLAYASDQRRGCLGEARLQCFDDRDDDVATPTNSRAS